MKNTATANGYEPTTRLEASIIAALQAGPLHAEEVVQRTAPLQGTRVQRTLNVMMANNVIDRNAAGFFLVEPATGKPAPVRPLPILWNGADHDRPAEPTASEPPADAPALPPALPEPPRPPREAHPDKSGSRRRPPPRPVPPPAPASRQLLNHLVDLLAQVQEPLSLQFTRGGWTVTLEIEPTDTEE
jgi:hypothetical protein